MTNSNELTGKILDNLATAIFLVDTSLTIRYANSAAEQLFGISARKFINVPLSQAFDYTTIDLDRIKHCHSKDIGYIDYEVSFVTEGQPILCEVSVTPAAIMRKSYNLLEIRKIDQQKKLNQEIQQHSQQQAARELIRSLAHEIKNPLGGLRGAAQLLERLFKDNDKADDIKEYTSVIIEQADRLKALVDRLLGPQKAHPHTLENIHLVLEKVRRLVSMDLPENIKIKCDYDPSIPEIMMSPEQLEQAVLNIVCNAILALKENQDSAGEIIIRTRAQLGVSIHGKIARMALCIQIIDNGPGIPPEIMDTVFYPMVTRRNGGTGLGLPLAQNIVDQHGGKIECSSRCGHTEFSIYIPLKE